MRIFFIFVFISFVTLQNCFAEEAFSSTSKPAPSVFPHVTSSMLMPGFWISQHPFAEKIVMTPEEIVAFNNDIQSERKLTKDIFTLVDDFKMESLLDVFKKNLQMVSDKGYFTIDGVRDDQDFLENVKKNLHLSGLVLGESPRYALVVHFANQRFLPTEKGLYEKRGDVDFDQLQNSGLDVGTPVAVVHQSLDKKWYYVLSSLSDGWVAADNIVLAKAEQVKSFQAFKDFIVVTVPRTEIYLDEAMSNFYDFTRMGVQYPLIGQKNDQWMIQIPIKDKEGQLQLAKGFIAKNAAHKGFLPYTPRAIYTQAFAMLDKPYGWGDMYGQQDCSRFLQMVYATVGISLPRDSKDQAQVGEPLASFDEKATLIEKLGKLKSMPGALTILPMKGHIMLYLGMVDGIPFAIHETSGYSENKDDVQIKYVINRVVVSDLSLGEASSKGSLLKRINKIVGIQSK